MYAVAPSRYCERKQPRLADARGRVRDFTPPLSHPSQLIDTLSISSQNFHRFLQKAPKRIPFSLPIPDRHRGSFCQDGRGEHPFQLGIPSPLALPVPTALLSPSRGQGRTGCSRGWRLQYQLMVHGVLLAPSSSIALQQTIAGR